MGATALFSCSDTLSEIGASIQPESDIVRLDANNISLSGRITTFKTDSIFSKTNTALIGSLNDVTYGEIKCDYMAQINCVSNFHIPTYSPYKDSLMYATITLEYQNYSGDSIAPMQVSVYKLNKQLSDQNIYSNVDPTGYYNTKDLLGTKTYSAKNIDRTIASASGYDTVEIKVKDSFFKEFVNQLKNSPTTFSGNVSFQKFFPGIYVSNTYGTGSILKVGRTTLNFYAMRKTYDGKKDSVTVCVASMANTEEVYLANLYKNNHIDNLILSSTADSVAYLKSPAGLSNRIKFPMKELATKVGTAKLNGAKLVVNTERVDPTKTVLPTPPALLIIKESDMDDFFKNGTTFDSKKEGIATFNSSTNTYTFTNLSTMFSELLKGNVVDDVNLVLLPVSYTVDASGNMSTIIHLHQPTGLKIFTNYNKFNLELIYAK